MLATDGGSPFGGYNPSGWLSTDDYYASNNAFLIVKKGGEWIKLPKLGGSDAAVFDYARSQRFLDASARLRAAEHMRASLVLLDEHSARGAPESSITACTSQARGVR